VPVRVALSCKPPVLEGIAKADLLSPPDGTASVPLPFESPGLDVPDNESNPTAGTPAGYIEPSASIVTIAESL
jgi:hypothetical protein